MRSAFARLNPDLPDDALRRLARATLDDRNRDFHRMQYDFIDGYTRHMRDALPNASFILRAVDDEKVRMTGQESERIRF